MIGILAAVARAAHGHPRAVVAVLAGLVIALIGLAIVGAVALVASPAAATWFLFAAISLVVFIHD